MRLIVAALAVIVILVIAAGVAVGGRQVPAANGPRVPVLAELFTSEGCSSCPAADEVLRTLLADQPVAGVEVIALSEHVDYWDRLGWKDRFSSPAFTERQTQYARVLGPGNIYTPQLVVNGRREMIGSDLRAISNALAAAAKAPRATLVPSAHVSDGTIDVSVRVTEIPEAQRSRGFRVVAAVAESAISSRVTSGENARRHLQHTSVVRRMNSIGILAAGEGGGEFTGRFAIDPAWVREQLRLVVFLQDTRSLAVSGVAAVPLP